MLKSLITDTVTYVVECVPKNFPRVCKDINTSWPYMVSPWKDFAVLYIQLTGRFFESLQRALN
jgi:hypothetical protein